MKILHLIPSLSKGGAERLVLDICRGMQESSGITVKLITFRKDNAYTFLTKGLDWEVVPANVTPSISGKTRVNVAALQNVIEAFEPDIIHSHLFESEMVLSQINYPNAKYVVHFHDNMVQLENWKWSNVFNKVKLTNFYEKNIVEAGYRNRKTEFIAISNETHHYIKRVLPDVFSVTLLHNAIDTKHFSPSFKKPNVEKPILTTIGSLVDKKGHDLAIKTIAELKNRGIDVELNILGDGVSKSKLETLIQTLELSDNILMRGNVDYPESYLQNSTLYLHTASYEPFGLVLLEAMACGLPVVCTDGGGNRDLIEEGINGFMVKERDPKRLADKIELLLTDSELRQQMGENAHVFAQQFSIETYVDRLLELYQE
jgi:glycosyltransferase involved in cell wall biosynthesis